MLSAQTGQDYLAYMKDQAAITNEWAADDRARQQEVFIPLQDKFIEQAQTWDSPERMGARVNQARTGVQDQIGAAQQQRQRTNAAMGVRPDSGRAVAGDNTAAIQSGLATANAGNLERRAVTGEAEAMRANAINLGSGLAVNPATSMGLSNGAASSGFGGAMNGYNQQGQLLNTQFQQQMQSHNANAKASSDLWGGIGNIVGMAFGSDENIKENRKPPRRSLLDAVDNMRVEEWDYKDGAGDEARHVGTYAQDFRKNTGMGDGKTINVIDAIGTTMGAIKELSAKVDAMGSGDRTVMTPMGKAPPDRTRRREIA